MQSKLLNKAHSCFQEAQLQFKLIKISSAKAPAMNQSRQLVSQMVFLKKRIRHLLAYKHGKAN